MDIDLNYIRNMTLAQLHQHQPLREARLGWRKQNVLQVHLGWDCPGRDSRYWHCQIVLWGNLLISFATGDDAQSDWDIVWCDHMHLHRKCLAQNEVWNLQVYLNNIKRNPEYLRDWIEYITHVPLKEMSDPKHTYKEWKST